MRYVQDEKIFGLGPNISPSTRDSAGGRRSATGNIREYILRHRQAVCVAVACSRALITPDCDKIATIKRNRMAVLGLLTSATVQPRFLVRISRRWRFRVCLQSIGPETRTGLMRSIVVLSACQHFFGFSLESGSAFYRRSNGDRNCGMRSISGSHQQTTITHR